MKSFGKDDGKLRLEITLSAARKPRNYFHISSGRTLRSLTKERVENLTFAYLITDSVYFPRRESKNPLKSSKKVWLRLNGKPSQVRSQN